MLFYLHDLTPDENGVVDITHCAGEITIYNIIFWLQYLYTNTAGTVLGTPRYYNIPSPCRIEFNTLDLYIDKVLPTLYFH